MLNLFSHVLPKKFLKGADRGSAESLPMPTEFLDEDERLRTITLRATRRTYLYHDFMLPTFLIFLLLRPTILWVILGFGLFAIGHYAVYWTGVVDALREK